MASNSVNKSSAYKAYFRMNKVCVTGCHCTSTCQLYIAKEIILDTMKSNNLVITNKFPSDILEIFRVLPIKPNRYSLMELYDAFDAVQDICHKCPSEVHIKYGKHCSINIILTALGMILHDKTFVTDKDKELTLSR